LDPGLALGLAEVLPPFAILGYVRARLGRTHRGSRGARLRGTPVYAGGRTSIALERAPVAALGRSISLYMALRAGFLPGHRLALRFANMRCHCARFAARGAALRVRTRCALLLDLLAELRRLRSE
jgi:hypothetical protein